MLNWPFVFEIISLEIVCCYQKIVITLLLDFGAGSECRIQNVELLVNHEAQFCYHQNITPE